MSPHEIKERLRELYIELAEVRKMTEEQACAIHNVDCKDEIVKILEEEIESLRDEDIDYDYTDEELEWERTTLCQSQGLSRYC